MPDRAARVARAIVQVFTALLHENDELFYHRLEQLLREEFADEQRQSIADRRLDPDA